MALYEAMFVVDSNKSRQDHDAVVEEINGVVQKGGGEVVNCTKWEERKLAYPLNRHRRGTYYLSHFNAEGEAIGRIERAAQLNETVLRVLVTVDEDGQEMPVFADTSDDDRRPRRPGGRDDSFRSDRPRTRFGSDRAHAAPSATEDNDSNDTTDDTDSEDQD